MGPADLAAPIIIKYKLSNYGLVTAAAAAFHILDLTDLKALSDASCRRRGRRVPNSLVAEDVGGELRLGLGDAGSGGSVVAVDLGQNEEVCEGGNDPACCDEDEHKADEIISPRGASVPLASSEGGDGDNQTTEMRTTVRECLEVRRVLTRRPSE